MDITSIKDNGGANVDHIERVQPLAAIQRHGDDGHLMIPAKRQPLSPAEWGEVQYIVHAVDPDWYSPAQEALVARAREELQTIETSVGRIAEPLLERLVEGLSGPLNEVPEDNWREIGRMQAEYGYFTAPIQERMNIQLLLIYYLQLVQSMTDYQQLIADNDSAPTVIAEVERRMTKMQSAFNRQNEALARLRRLSVPMPVQINIGGQQVNVAGSALPTFP